MKGKVGEIENMKVKISEILKLKTQSDVDDFLESRNINALQGKNIKEEHLNDNWVFVGNNVSNASSIDILGKGEKGVIERLSNAVDSVLELQKINHNMRSARSADDIIKRAFPTFYKRRKEILGGNSKKENYTFDSGDNVILAFNSGDESTKPTIDIIDLGIGIQGNDFGDTILSLQGGNKISTEKSYLIGSFGQGGSTSLSYCSSTVILSKNEGEYFFTVVKKVNLVGYKNHTYVYLTENGNIMSAIEDDVSEKNYTQKFIDSESGTLVRMIETEISKKFRDNDITKPLSFLDYIDTELFDVALPIKVIENREQYSSNAKNQNRNSYGSLAKLKTSAHVQKSYSGNIEVDHRNRIYKLEYFVILPTNEAEWSIDSKCRDVYQRFNIHGRPIIYTVNGQYINGEGFTKLKNAGLNFLENRLLVVIDLDELGTEKYNFFTPDRDRIRETEETKGFLDKVIQTLSMQPTLTQINEIIGTKSLSGSIDENQLEEISREVRGQYLKFLKEGVRRGKNKGVPRPREEVIYYNEIKELVIATTKNEFYANEAVTIILNTKANSHVNKEAKIDSFINGKAEACLNPSFLNSKIMYNYGEMKPGKYSIFYEMYGDKQFSSNTHTFVVLEEKLKNIKGDVKSNIDLSVEMVEGKELISDLIIGDKITVLLSFDHEGVVENLRGMTESKVKQVKIDLVKPVALFTLFMKEDYNDQLENDIKNKMVSSFIKSYLASYK